MPVLGATPTPHPLFLSNTGRNICTSLNDHWTPKYYRDLSKDYELKPILLVRNEQTISSNSADCQLSYVKIYRNTACLFVHMESIAAFRLQ